jgi:hypothetical protein
LDRQRAYAEFTRVVNLGRHTLCAVAAPTKHRFELLPQQLDHFVVAPCMVPVIVRRENAYDSGPLRLCCANDCLWIDRVDSCREAVGVRRVDDQVLKCKEGI